MATLNEVFTNIANAIRSKKGTTDKMTPTNMPSEIESIESGGGSGLVGYSGKITFTGLTSYYNLSYLVIHSDGTYENITSVSETNNVSDAVYIVVYVSHKYALASVRLTNANRIFGDAQVSGGFQTTAENWTIEFYEDL